MRALRICAQLLLSLVAVGTLTQCAKNNAGDTPGSIVVGGVTRTYVYHVPAALAKPAPLVLVFHGHYMTGELQSEMSHLDPLSDERGFILVYPDGIKRGWNDGRARNKGTDDIGLLHALIADFSHRYAIDAKRIYVTGFSNGATFSEYVGCTQADRIAAFAPVSGPMPNDIEPHCHPQRSISVLAIDGTSDPIVPYNGGQIHIAGIGRGSVLSAQKNIAFWSKNAHCAPIPQITKMPTIAPSDGTRVTHAVYSGCAPGAGIELYSVNGGGHAWPQGPQYLPTALVGKASTQLDADRAVIDFFYAHPLRS